MRIFVAGATGAAGRPLLPRLVQAGHLVAGMTRSPQRAAAIRAAGADPIVCDVFDYPRLAWAIAEARPDVVIHQLTDLPPAFDAKRLAAQYGANNRIRIEGTKNLLAAAREARVRRFVVQSLATWYAPGPGLKTEEDPLWLDAPEPVAGGVRAVQAMEAAVLGSGLQAVVLRYGSFYGPGTWYEAGGSIGERVRAGSYPLIGPGNGVSSFLHVEDAASATLAALAEPASGIYNVADSDPAPAREWLPELAEALGGPKPKRVPLFMARLSGWRGVIDWQHRMAGVSNEKIRRELRWEPRFWSWREGFRNAV